MSEKSSRPIALLSDRILAPEGLVDGHLVCDGPTILGIEDRPPAGALVFDCRGLLVAPALIDVHGDAFERQVAPRPGVHFPLDTAVLDTDRQLAANGIATAYHALTLSWEPGLRAVSQGEAWVDALDANAPRCAVDHRVQLRWETFEPAAIPLIARALAGARRPSVAFNDHVSMMVRPLGQRVQDRAPDCDPDRPVADFADPAFVARVGGNPARAGLKPDAYIDRLARMWATREAVPASIAEVAALARAAGAPMLSHDDNSPTLRAYYRGHGARVCEFPMTVETARAARAAGDAIVFGAPNAVRGGSHIGSPSTLEMVAEGLCDMLASDYFYPAMLIAVARIVADGHADLATAWSLVSSGPAQAHGLTDRGHLAPGARADVVVVDWPDGATPAVRATFSGGEIAHLSRLEPRA
jgi:alpha-D-ribose 1-methylphosphonate 5-triphosphate diphosphatase